MSLMIVNQWEVHDLKSIIRVLAKKVAQIVVQSRNGRTSKTECEENPLVHEWFNMSIPDVQEINAKTECALQKGSIDAPTPLIIEISLNTAEKDAVLELWTLGVLSHHSDSSLKVSNNEVYAKMEILLKSLLLVTRMVPGYKISRRQDPNSYVVNFRILKEKPYLGVLGPRYESVRVGKMLTKAGTIHLAGFYRSNMDLSSIPTSRSPLMLVQNHFKASNEPEYRENKDDESSYDAIVAVFASSKHEPVKKENTSIAFDSLLSISDSRTPSELTDSVGYGSDEPNILDESTISDSRGLTDDGGIPILGITCPFANEKKGMANRELERYYRDIRLAPSLCESDEDRTLAEQLGDLAKLLEVYEERSKEYDECVEFLRSVK